MHTYTVRSGKWKLQTEKNRDEYQSKKDAETDLSDSDGRKIRDLADTYEQRRSWPRYAQPGAAAAAEKYFRLYDRRTALSGR